MRKTIGRVATLHQVAGFGALPLAELLSKIQAEIKRAANEDIEVDVSAAPPEPLDAKEARLEVLKTSSGSFMRAVTWRIRRSALPT